MNRRMIIYVLGKLLIVLSGLMILPLIISFIYKEEL